MTSIVITGANRRIGLGLVREVLKDASYGAVYATTRKMDGAKVGREREREKERERERARERERGRKMESESSGATLDQGPPAARCGAGR